MQTHNTGTISTRRLATFLLTLFILVFGTLTFAQDDTEAEDNSPDPVMLGFAVARETVEEERGEPLRLVRWRYYEDNWSNDATLQQYGSFGIENCIAEIPVHVKRTDILFGWTFSLLDVSGKEYQARVSYDLAESVICDEVHVPPQFAPAAAPAPAEGEASAVAPAASTANTGGFALGGHVVGLDGTAASLMKRAGMTWVKKQVTHHISDGGSIIGAARAHGFKVLLGALGDKNRLAADFDGYVREFADYVGFLASQGADAIEVWNEPNIQHEWPSGQINGASYTRLLQAAYQSIKAANPATIVVSGAPAPTGFSATGCEAGGCNDNTFVAQMAQAGAANFMDCVGVHYNAGAVPPTARSGAPVGSAGHYSWYLPSMMQVYRAAFPGKPLCFTELGYVTGEGLGALPTRFAWANGNTLANQAAWLAGAVNVARGSGYVSMIIVWNVNFTHWGGDPQAGYAMLRPGGACPACDSLGAAMRS